MQNMVITRPWKWKDEKETDAADLTELPLFAWK